MKKILILLLTPLILVSMIGCTAQHDNVNILTTTAPVFTFTSQLCTNTDLIVDCLITENVSCLHDYTLQTRQMRAIQGSNLVIISGAGLEESFSDALPSDTKILDASVGIALLCSDDHEHTGHDHEHYHSEDPHIWLAPQNAMLMVNNIAAGLVRQYPQYATVIEKNRLELQSRLAELDAYGKKQLNTISCRELITFHDGFAYMAESFGLHLLYAIEEESGREASASELIHLCNLVTEHHLPAVFVEKSGSVSAAKIISAETDTKLYQLDMAMSGDYFTAMYHNINTLEEALR